MEEEVMAIGGGPPDPLIINGESRQLGTCSSN